MMEHQESLEKLDERDFPAHQELLDHQGLLETLGRREGKEYQ